MTDTATKRCRACGQDKPLTEFHKLASASDGRQYTCKQCRADAAKATRPAARARQARYRESHREALRATNREYGRRRYQADPPAGAARVREAGAAARAQVFGHYGRVCECCGTAKGLEIDHVNGDGGEHRRELFGGQVAGVRFYRWLIREGFPAGFGVLCHPCNKSKDKGTHCRLRH